MSILSNSALARGASLVGLEFGRLRVQELISQYPETPERVWRCQCRCLNFVNVRASKLRSGHTKSCGCLQKEKASSRAKTHGLSESRTYRIWAGIIQRCANPKNQKYPHYGGRGIQVCERWLSFENFLEDMGHAPYGLTLDRIKVNLGYFKENCQWATQKEQTRNTRVNRLIEFQKQIKPLAEWAEILGMNYQTLHSRLARGWTVQRAFLTPTS